MIRTDVQTFIEVAYVTTSSSSSSQHWWRFSRLCPHGTLPRVSTYVHCLPLFDVQPCSVPSRPLRSSPGLFLFFGHPSLPPLQPPAHVQPHQARGRQGPLLLQRRRAGRAQGRMAALGEGHAGGAPAGLTYWALGITTTTPGRPKKRSPQTNNLFTTVPQSNWLAAGGGRKKTIFGTKKQNLPSGFFRSKIG